MKRGWKIRLMGFLAAAVLGMAALCPAALADEYDKNYPELLSEGHLTAVSAIVMEADSGRTIFQKNADERMYPASTTKILTVWLALMMGASLENGMDTPLPVSENAVNLAPDESSAKFAAGENVRLIDLCYAAMLVSGNDAATAIAEGLGGTVENYVGMMNQAARSLGCYNTHFVNANGLHDENHFTTARDLANLSRIAMQDETFRKIVGADSYTLPKDNIYRARSIANGNNFVAESKDENTKNRFYPGSTGIKTGTTSAAGNCLVASASRDGVNLITVVLGATSDTSRYEDTIKLMDYGFSQFMSTSIAEIYLRNPRVIDIRGFDLNDEEVGRLTLDIRLQSTGMSDTIVTTREEMENWVQNFSSFTVTEFTRELKAPVTKGEVMGTLSYYGGSDVPVVYDLVASRSIAAREQLFPSVEQIIADAENDPNPFPRITVELVLIYLILPAAAVFAAWKVLKILFRLLKKRRKVKAYKPTSRYYR
jgi:D-alanyl-D-alanine carboxypeptidase (penicillin-binding protein 5/6)